MSILRAPSVTSQYFGNAGGSTSRYYWVQTIFPVGHSILTAAPALSNTQAGLSQSNYVLISWTPVPGAIGYRVWSNTVNTLPTGPSSLTLIAGSETSFTDTGATYSTATVHYSGLFVYRARYSFATDGGAVATITPVDSDIVPVGFMPMISTIYSPTAVTSLGSATVAIGVGAQTTLILAATGKASYSAAAVLGGAVTPAKVTTAAAITFTVAVAALTGGIVEVHIAGFVASGG